MIKLVTIILVKITKQLTQPQMLMSRKKMKKKLKSLLSRAMTLIQLILTIQLQSMILMMVAKIVTKLNLSLMMKQLKMETKMRLFLSIQHTSRAKKLASLLVVLSAKVSHPTRKMPVSTFVSTNAQLQSHL